MKEISFLFFIEFVMEKSLISNKSDQPEVIHSMKFVSVLLIMNVSSIAAMIQLQWRCCGQGGGQTREHHGYDARQEEEGPLQRHDRGRGSAENAA